MVVALEVRVEVDVTESVAVELGVVLGVVDGVGVVLGVGDVVGVELGHTAEGSISRCAYRIETWGISPAPLKEAWTPKLHVVRTLSMKNLHWYTYHSLSGGMVRPDA